MGCSMERMGYVYRCPDKILYDGGLPKGDISERPLTEGLCGWYRGSEPAEITNSANNNEFKKKSFFLPVDDCGYYHRRLRTVKFDHRLKI